ncbi:hypothetical protein [Endozoicomonas sp. GU-1]|uniref:hypothetical protein n=1 Tax=Endozoicomonas sp. GU-1 TaxID=3009078 RepID=UPI0022B38C37|nr:hypothetical protein [Endozoicomonas sp. GU-1]WBA80848.1 hypothetical protein O2T12_21460 [Endozoicomonas sp. GU-1]WBA88410.1 hypothetical protein O3276_10645 [Endozoicomonas sp. GU-1]
MFKLPRNPLCHQTPGVGGSGPVHTNYEPTPKEAEAPVGSHRGRKIENADTTSYLAEQKSVVTGADSPSPLKTEATQVPAHHTTGLKENKPDSQAAKLLQERTDLLQRADSVLGAINARKVVGISLEALDKAQADSPEQVLAMLKSMEFPAGLSVKITLKSQSEKPLSLIPPGDELENQKNLDQLMKKTIDALKRQDQQYANTEASASEAEEIRQSLVRNDNEITGRETLGQGEGAQAFDKLSNRKCAITVHHRNPVEKSYVETRHHDTSARPATGESSAITAREDSPGIEKGNAHPEEQDLTTTTASGAQKQTAPIVTDPPEDTQQATPVYPVPLPSVDSSQTAASPQPEEAKPALPQQRATGFVVQSTPLIQETEQESTPAAEHTESVPTEEDRAVTEPVSAQKEQTDAVPDSTESPQETVPVDSHSPLPETIPAPPLAREEIRETASIPAEQSDVEQAMALQQAESSTDPITEQTAKSQVRQPEKQENLHAALLRELKNRQRELKSTKPNQPIEGNSTQTSDTLSPNDDTANTPKASRPGSHPELMAELTKKLADRRPKTPEEVDTLDSNVARKWAKTAERLENSHLPFIDELMEKVAARNRAMEETAQPSQSALSSNGYKPAETTVSFPPFPAADALPAGQRSSSQTNSKATNNIAVPKSETKNTSSGNKTFNDAQFKAELEAAVAKMLRRSSDTMDADDITDSSVSDDQLPEDVTADLNNINAALSPEEPGETAQPILNNEATTPLAPAAPPVPPPISQEILSARTRKAPASTSSAPANSPDNANKTESGNVAKSKPSDQGFFGSEIFKTALKSAATAMENKRQSSDKDIEQQIQEAKKEAKEKKEQTPNPNDLFGSLRKKLFPIRQANDDDKDKEDEQDGLN